VTSILRRRIFTLLLVIVSVGILPSYSAFAQTPSAIPNGTSDTEDLSLAGLSHPYFVWLTEDVSYIISPDERTAFLRLVKDDDRDLFIEQFWQRRNPDPESKGSGETNCEAWIQSLLEAEPEDSSKFTFRFKRLDSAIVARAALNDVRFGYHFDSIPATPFTTLVPIAIQIPSFEFGSQSGASAQALRLNLFLRVADARGRVVETFEDWLPEVADIHEAQDSASAYTLQKSIALRPGSYDVAIAVGNPESGNIGTAYAQLAVLQMTDHR
jgi:hypothetical protein